MNKKIFILMLLMVLLIGTVNASFEFDNAISNYDEETETITYKNGILFNWGWTCTGDIIVEIMADHQNINVESGENLVVVSKK